ELGVWASSPFLAVILRLFDGFFHIFLPSLLLCRCLTYIQLWMAPVALGTVFLSKQPLISMLFKPQRLSRPYTFKPPRSQQFWEALYKMELLLNFSVPILCYIVRAQSWLMYSVTLFTGLVVMTLQVLRSIMLPKIRSAAATIMQRLLQHGEIQVLSPSTVPRNQQQWDIVVQNPAFWLDWMSDGLVAIGESFVSGQWEVNPNGEKSLDAIVVRLLTLPIEARREMYQSWYARFVSLAARIFNYPSSSAGLIVGPVSEMYDVGAGFQRHYYEVTYFYHGFGMWLSDRDTLLEAQERTLHMIAEKLQLQPGDHVLDLNLASCGGVGCFLARFYQVHVDSIVSSEADRIIALQLAQSAGLTDQIQFIVVEPGKDIAQMLNQLLSKRYQAITAGQVIEITPEIELPRLLYLMKDKLSQNGRLVLDFVASPARPNTHAWSNKHIVPHQPYFPVSYTTVKNALVAVDWTILEAHSYADHYDKTYLAWYNAFQSVWPSIFQGKLPESFRRTWEFYLLHTAACYRARKLQGYQVTLRSSISD
ncbi:hypothetical protein THRCLA_10205, partial [Thraustotheca clavata]